MFHRRDKISRPKPTYYPSRDYSPIPRSSRYHSPRHYSPRGIYRGGFPILNTKTKKCSPQMSLTDVNVKKTQQQLALSSVTNPMKQILIVFNNGNKIIFRFKRHIASGTFGNVDLYSASAGQSIAVKTENRAGGLNEDIVVLRTIRGDCDTIGGYPFNVTSANGTRARIIIMNKMDGSLEDFTTKILNQMQLLDKHYLIFIILFQILKNYYCLYKHGLYYTDSKLLNILYKCSDNRYEVTLGDLGSAKPNNVKASYTYPSYFRDKSFYPEVYDIVYGILPMYALLLALKDDGVMTMDYTTDQRYNFMLALQKQYQVQFISHPSVLEAYNAFWKVTLLSNDKYHNNPKLFKIVLKAMENMIRALEPYVSPTLIKYAFKR